MNRSQRASLRGNVRAHAATYYSIDSYVTIHVCDRIAGVKTSFWDNMLEIHKTTLFTDVFNFHQLKRANTDPGHVVGALVQMIQSGDYFPAQTWVLLTTGIASPSKVRLGFESRVVLIVF